MQKHIINEKTHIPYTLVGDYYLPWGDLPDDEPEEKPIGIWGQRHLRFIKQHKKVLYSQLLTFGKLNGYLADIDQQAEGMFFRLVKQFAAQEGITEELKAADQMAWVQQMNNIRARAMEIVNSEIIYT